MSDDLMIPTFLDRRAAPLGHVCSKCGGDAEFGYRVQGEMQWYCSTHRLAQRYADARASKAVEPAPRNDPLAEHASAIRTLGKRVVADVIEIGRHLTEARDLCNYGEWQPWLEQEFSWDRKTADRFIAVFKLDGKVDNLSTLDVPVSGLYLLAAPSTPEKARQEIFDRAESGERVSVAQVRETITDAKKPPSESIPSRAATPDLPPNHKQIAAGLTLARQMSLPTLDEFLVGLRQIRREKKRHA